MVVEPGALVGDEHGGTGNGAVGKGEVAEELQAVGFVRDVFGVHGESISLLR
jgi:hypothetical protein